MTQRFILDENVVILAQKRENDRGEPDSTCLNLFTQIITICHTIVVDHNLWSKYQHQLSPPRQSDAQESFRVLAVLDYARQIEGKIEFNDNAPSFLEENSIPQGSRDDVFIVRLAVETRAILVTTDIPLRNALNSCGAQEAYNLQVCSRNDALHQL
jgi:hypothetical protein